MSKDPDHANPVSPWWLLALVPGCAVCAAVVWVVGMLVGVIG